MKMVRVDVNCGHCGTGMDVTIHGGKMSGKERIFQATEQCRSCGDKNDIVVRVAVELKKV